jgi:hypothetical protein
MTFFNSNAHFILAVKTTIKQLFPADQSIVKQSKCQQGE